MSAGAIRQAAGDKGENRHSNGTGAGTRGPAASSGRFTLETTSNPSSGGTATAAAAGGGNAGRATSGGSGGSGGGNAASEKQESTNRRTPGVSLALAQPQPGSNDNSFDSLSLSSATPTSPPLTGPSFRFSPKSSAESQLAAKASPNAPGAGQTTLSPGGHAPGGAAQSQAQVSSPAGSPGAGPPAVPPHQSAPVNLSRENQLSVGPAFKRPILADVGRSRTGTGSASSHSRNFSHPRDLFRAFQAALRSGGKRTQLTRQTSAEANNTHVLDSFTSVPGSSPQSPRPSRLNSLSVGSPTSTPMGSGPIPGGGPPGNMGGSSGVSRGGLKILVNGQQHRASPLAGESGGNSTGSNTPTTILKTPVGRTSSSGSGKSIPARGPGAKKNTVTFDTRCLSLRRCSADAGAMLAATEEEHLGRQLTQQHKANSHTPLSGTASIDTSVLQSGQRLLNPGGSEKPRRKQLEVPFLSLVRTPLSAEIKRDLDAPFEHLHALLEPVNSVSLMDASDLVASLDDFDCGSSPSHSSAPKGASSPARGRSPSLASVQVWPSSPSQSTAQNASREQHASSSGAAAGASGTQGLPQPMSTGSNPNRPTSPISRMDRLDSGASTSSSAGGHSHAHSHSHSRSGRARPKERMGSTSSEGRIDMSNTGAATIANISMSREARERVRLEGLDHKRVSSPQALSPLSPSARGGGCSPLLQVNDACIATLLIARSY